MMKISSILLLGALALANAGAISKSQRNGESNRYFLYTKTVEAEVLDVDEAGSFDPDNNTIVIVHGHQGDYQHDLNNGLLSVLLHESVDDLNIIVVDWSEYAKLSYTMAESVVPSIAYHLATFLDSIDYVPANTHLVGFNLGAHIVGVAGRRLGQIGDNVARITGLDPSKSANRLSRTDANYVEVIHTDSIGILNHGLKDQMGHADFYPNGGGNQPGCFASHQCSHDRAWSLFAASIYEATFNARCCNTMSQNNLNLCRGQYLPMGGIALPHNKRPCASGIYRINTGPNYPYV